MTGPDSLDAWEWFGHRTFHHPQFSDVAALLERKRLGTTVSVCLPTRNERGTIGPILRAIRTDLMQAVPLVDELAVMDGGSQDGTVAIAVDEGAAVFQEREVEMDQGDLGGKGDAPWKSLFVLRGDLMEAADIEVVERPPAASVDSYAAARARARR